MRIHYELRTNETAVYPHYFTKENSKTFHTLSVEFPVFPIICYFCDVLLLELKFNIRRLQYLMYERVQTVKISCWAYWLILNSVSCKLFLLFFPFFARKLVVSLFPHTWPAFLKAFHEDVISLNWNSFQLILPKIDTDIINGQDPRFMTGVSVL